MRGSYPAVGEAVYVDYDIRDPYGNRLVLLLSSSGADTGFGAGSVRFASPVVRAGESALTLSFPGGQVLAASYDEGEDLVLMIAEISGNQASLDKSSPIDLKQNTSASKVTFETEQGICAKTDSYFWQGGLFQGKTTWTKND